ncbi:FtsX-like permease family protein [Bacillus paranthracis]|uniref:FtsX-like permease family protein n=1 Tax=Bacillus cereus group TaxID=86661 RepID=UPI0022E29C60|nr:MULTISPECIES: FtsX-like permease family protein [Bacillus cereus group]MDA1888618.1 FtsX-like permease family protein [Bacillus cereus group sp. BY11-1LC]MDA2589317.1 FtsX-like permease family protein [Bacillus cereus group sp. Bc065]MDK7440639.1 FtsX-like permease family protein [Bacillus paranthracis]MDK7456712.1 FtsX-like permease family protein [Bacillus paranthracis]
MSFNHIVLQNILRDKWTYISYFLSSVFSILIFFLFSIIAFHPMVATIQIGSTLSLVMMLTSFIVYIFSFVFIIYSMFSFLKKKTKNLGIFMITGASMQQVRKMLFRENMFIAGIAILTAIVLGLVIAPLFLMITKKVLQASSFGMYIPVQAIVLTTILFAILFCIVSKFITRFINKEEAVLLLKTDVTQEKLITPAPWKLLLSVITSGFLALSLILELNWIESPGMVYYLLLFVSSLLAIYFIITQGMLLSIRVLQKQPSYYQKTNMLYVSNLKAKGRSHAHLIYLLTILLLGVFLCTNVLYSSYYNIDKRVESLEPYSFQYISLPGNKPESEQEDVSFIEHTLAKQGKYEAYYSAFKTDKNQNIGFMSVSNYNAFSIHKTLFLKDDEYYVVAGYQNILPSTELIHDYPFGELQYAGIEKQNILMSGVQRVYYIVPDAVYETIDYPIFKVFSYEVEHWTEKNELAETIFSKITPIQYERQIHSKINLYNTEKFTVSLLFFIGFMMSLIFLSAAMSILYFYLQMEIEGEKEKYAGIRKLGFSIKELASVVTKELATLIFIPFVLASILLCGIMFAMRNQFSSALYGVTAIGVGIFLLLFVISFFIIRRSYLKKLMN